MNRPPRLGLAIPLYRKAAKAAPARPTPRPTGPGVWMAPAPIEPKCEDEGYKSSVGEGLKEDPKPVDVGEPGIDSWLDSWGEVGRVEGWPVWVGTKPVDSPAAIVAAGC